MRLLKIAKFAAAEGLVPNKLLDVNRKDRPFWVTEAEFESLALSGVLADEILAPTEAINFAGGVLASSATTPIGYATGAGGAVTQITSASTGVTLSKPCGQITTVALTTAAAAEEAFVVTNTLVDANDVIAVCTTYAGAGKPVVFVTNVGSGVFTINISNVHAANALDAVLIINFVVIKSVAA